MITIELKNGTVLLGTDLRQSQDSHRNVYNLGFFINGVLTTTSTFNQLNVFKADFSGMTDFDTVNSCGFVDNKKENTIDSKIKEQQ